MSLPAYLQNLPSRNLAQTAIANVGAGTPPYLSIAGGRFSLVDVAGNIMSAQKMDAQGNIYIDVVIVDVNNHVSKIFFGLNKPYDPDNPTPPVCFSDNGMAPSQGSGQPQSPTCASCPHNVWGSKISQMGSAVKQCADQQKIAIYAPEYSDGLFLLRIPPGSFVNWRAYMAKFAGAGLDPDRVITRISFERDAVGTLVFQSPGYITEQMAGTVAHMIESKASEMMIGRLDRPRDAALPPPVSQGQLQPALPPQQQPFPQSQPIQPVAVPATGPFAGQPAQTAAPAPLTLAPTSTFPSSPAASGMPVQAADTSQPRRRRRTKAEMEAARAPQPAGQMQPPAPTQAPFRPDPPPPTNPAQFGMQANPPPPPPGLDLDAVFK